MWPTINTNHDCKSDNILDRVTQKVHQSSQRKYGLFTNKSHYPVSAALIGDYVYISFYTNTDELWNNTAVNCIKINGFWTQTLNINVKRI